MRSIITLIICLLSTHTLHAQLQHGATFPRVQNHPENHAKNRSENHPENRAKNRAGDTVSIAIIKRLGLPHFFTINPIDDTTFSRMQGRSYKADCTLPREELRLLRILHHDGAGRIRIGELICNRLIAADLIAIFRELYDVGYPIERMVLIDEYEGDDNRSMAANNSSAFNFRTVAGSKTLSAHSRGMAVDINPLYNPYVRTRNGRTTVEPAAAAPYVDRSRNFRYKIERDDACCRAFLRHGFIWGGDWRSLKDWQHFEKKL